MFTIILMGNTAICNVPTEEEARVICQVSPRLSYNRVAMNEDSVTGILKAIEQVLRDFRKRNDLW